MSKDDENEEEGNDESDSEDDSDEDNEDGLDSEEEGIFICMINKKKIFRRERRRIG